MTDLIRPVRIDDSAALAAIYNYYVTDTVITFEEAPLITADMGERVKGISAQYPYLVWEENGAVNGFAYLNTFKTRSAFRFSLEDTIYLRHGTEGRGMGAKLFAALLAEAQKMSVHALLSCITIPNERSVRLHEKAGFTQVALMREVGYKFARWLDVGYWELILEN